jgi:hypothetical protein
LLVFLINPEFGRIPACGGDRAIRGSASRQLLPETAASLPQASGILWKFNHEVEKVKEV